MTPASPIAVSTACRSSCLTRSARRWRRSGSCCSLALIALVRGGAARRREAEAARERQEAIEARFAALAQSGAELNGRVAGMAEWLGSRQTDLARVVADRLDSVGARLGAGLETQAQTTGENLGKLNERLAVIDAAQARLTEMTARGRLAEGHSREQAGARRLRTGADGGDRARRPAGRRLRFPVHADEPRPARLRHPPARRRAAARGRRQVPARRLFGPAGCARRRGAKERPGACARRCRQACEGHRRALSSARARPRTSR